MSLFHKKLIVLVAASLLMAGCSRRPGVIGSELNPAANPQLPFDSASDASGASPTAALPLEYIPAGTLFTVHMQSSLSSASARSGDSFRAVLDDGIVIQNQVFAERGAVLTGRVIVARSAVSRDPGYMRLTLTALNLRGSSFPMETSTIFLKGGPPLKGELALIPAASREHYYTPSAMRPPEDVEFPALRRLTFRLMRPLPLPN